MLPAIQAFIVVEIVRVFCISAGCFLAYLGFRLFRLGIYEHDGELEAKYKDVSLTLRQIGPGVFFALFGVAMAYTGFARKFEIGPTVEVPVPAVSIVRPQIEDVPRPAPAPSPRTHSKAKVRSSAPTEAQATPPPTPRTDASGSTPNALTTEQLQQLQQMLHLSNSMASQVGAPH